jgi:hypothetical protein
MAHPGYTDAQGGAQLAVTNISIAGIPGRWPELVHQAWSHVAAVSSVASAGTPWDQGR